MEQWWYMVWRDIKQGNRRKEKIEMKVGGGAARVGRAPPSQWIPHRGRCSAEWIRQSAQVESRTIMHDALLGSAC